MWNPFRIQTRIKAKEEKAWVLLRADGILTGRMELYKDEEDYKGWQSTQASQ